MKTLGQAALLACAFVLGGCFTYAPMATQRITPGTDVRVRVSPDAAARLEAESEAQATRPGRTVSGLLVDAPGPDLLLDVRVPTGASAVEDRRSLFRRVSIPLADVVEVEVRRLDRKRTVLLSAGIAAALTAFVLPYLSGEFGGTTKPGQ